MDKKLSEIKFCLLLMVDVFDPLHQVKQNIKTVK